jgi:putative intracellular protease/amidase
MKKYLYVIVLIVLSTNLFAQTEESKIRVALLNYIEGTSYNQVARIKEAFYEKANLYLDGKEEDPRIVPSTEYISWFEKAEEGKFNGRVGKIMTIDAFEKIALAKAEILIPSGKVRYVDMFILRKVNNQWKIISKTATREESNKSGKRILFIVSNAHFYGTSDLPTGNSFSELVNAYDTFTQEGYTVDFVSPKGGSVPLAYINTSDSLQKEYLYNPDFMFALNHTKTAKELNSKDYQAVHYIGGGSAMFEVPQSTEIQELVMEVYEKHGGIISSVCHGTAGIVNLKTQDGKFLVNGKTVSGYPDTYERKDAAYFKEFPFLIQQTIEERGGVFKYSPRNTAHVEVDGNVVTGQNHLSSSLVALEVIKFLKNKDLK